MTSTARPLRWGILGCARITRRGLIPGIQRSTTGSLHALASRELGIEKITRTFGLSRASLYRLFEPVGGVACYIRTRRLARARKELTAPGLQDHRIGPIAYRAGFQSIPAFNRAFREAYGEPPRNARKPEGGLVVATTPRGRMGVLARWLLEIS